MLEENEREREALEWGFGGQGGADEAFVGEDLEALGHAGGKFAACLDFVEEGVSGLGSKNLGVG